MKMKQVVAIALGVMGIGVAAWAAEAVKPVAQYVTEERADKSTIPNCEGDQGFIADAATFATFWAAWSKAEAPKIDFTANFVCIAAQDVGNRNQTRHVGLRMEDGIAQFTVWTTLANYTPTGRYTCTVYVFPRAGIRAIKQVVVKDGKYIDKTTPLSGAVAK